MTTMLLSTSMPTPSARPDSEIRFSVTPEKYISVTAHRRLKGMLHATMSVGRASRKKRMSTRMASAPPHRRFDITLSTTMAI